MDLIATNGQDSTLVPYKKIKCYYIKIIIFLVLNFLLIKFRNKDQ